MMQRMILLAAAVITFALGDALYAMDATTITLRSSVRLSGEHDAVRLADIADLTGPDAAALGELVIAAVEDDERVLEVSLRQVRTALDEAGIHWGRTHLNGSAVIVRPRGRSMAAPPLAMAEVSVASSTGSEGRARPERAAIIAADLRRERTLRGAVTEYLIQRMGVSADDLRLEFDDRHRDLLDTSLEDAQFEIEPVSRLQSNRIDLAIRVWSDGRPEQRRTISVTPMIRTPVVLMRGDVDRNGVVAESDVRIEHKWLPPQHGGLVTSVAETVGRVASVRLREGEMLREQHVRRETLIRRGEQVIVRCVIGGTVISIQAEARADGSEGDTIEFRKLGERETFLATVTGRNQALVDLRR